MTQTAATREVVNLATGAPDWTGKLKDALRQAGEIVVLAPAMDARDQEKLLAFCRQAGRPAPEPVAERDWEKLKTELNLAGLAGKEQGINGNMVYLIRAAPPPSA